MVEQLDEDVLMEIEVKFGKGRSDSVIVHNNDDPTELAKAFVSRHGLKSSSIPIISQYLENTIDSFLATYTSRDDDEEDNQTVGSLPKLDQSNGKTQVYDGRNPLYDQENSADSASLKSDYISTVNTLYNGSAADIKNSREESTYSLQSFSADSLSVSSIQGYTDAKSILSESTYVTTIGGIAPEVRRIQSSLPIGTNALNSEQSIPVVQDESINPILAIKPDPKQNSNLKLNTSQANTSATNSLAKLFSTSAVTGRNPPASERPGRVNSSSRLEEFFGLGNKGILGRTERALSASQVDSSATQDAENTNFMSSSSSGGGTGMRTFSLTSADAKGLSSLSPSLRNLSLSKEFSWFGRTRTSSRSETPVLDGSGSPRVNEVDPNPLESSSKNPKHALSEASFGICEIRQVKDTENNDPNPGSASPLPPTFDEVDCNAVVTGMQQPAEVHSPAASNEDIYDAMNPQQHTAVDTNNKQESPFHHSYLDVLLENPELTLRSHTMSIRIRSAGGGSHLSITEEKVDEGNSYEAAEEVSVIAESCNTGLNAGTVEEDGEAGSDSSAEERYNRLKAFTNTNKRPVIDPFDDTSVFSESGTTRLRPSGSIMNMGASKNLEKNAKESSNKNVSSLVGKPVGERLFITAAINKSKKEGMENLKVVEMDRSIAKGQFKLNRQSKRIVQNLVRSGGSDDDDVHSRLHADGVREKELKRKRAEDLKDYLKPEDWSCSRCGLFHRISTAGLGLHPIHNGISASHQLQQQQKQRICTNCGWNQSETTPFHPVNIGLALLGNEETKTELLNNRSQTIQKQLLHDQSPGGASGYPSSDSRKKKASAETIHNYLYENAKQKDTMQKLNQALVEESLKSLTFNPSIPAASKEIILQKYQEKQQQQQQVQEPDTSIAGTQNSSSRSHLVGGASLAEYFSKPPAERLSVTTRTTREDEHRKASTPSRNPIRDKNKPKSAAKSESKLPTTKMMKAGEVDKLVNRLTYEYKEKNARLKKESDKHHKFDAKTGKPLFRPVIPSLEACDSSLLNDSICSTETTSGRRRLNNEDVFTDILRRDDLLKQKRNLSQARAIEEEMKDMSIHRAKALETSNSILKDSREKQIEELYRMLIVSTSFTAGTATATATGAGGSTTEDDLNRVSSDDLKDYKSRVLDFGLVHTDAMVPEVSALLRDMRREYEHLCRLNRTETYQDTDDEEEQQQLEQEEHEESPLVTFDEFRTLALRAIKHRNGTGKAYICAPKKKPEVAMQMVIKNLKEETFHPTIDKNSLQLAQRPVTSKLKTVAIEDILQAEGERLKSKLEIARFEKFMKESKDYTYKPHLFKPPSYVKPKYRGLNESMSEHDQDQDHEQDYHHHPPNHAHAHAHAHTKGAYFYEEDDNSTILTDELMSVSNSVEHERDIGLPPLVGGHVGYDRAEISYLSSGSPENNDNDDMDQDHHYRHQHQLGNPSQEDNLVGVDGSRRFSGGTVDSHAESTVHEALELRSLHHQYNKDSSSDMKLDAFIDINNHRRESSNSMDSFPQQSSPVRSEVTDMYTRLKSMKSKHSINRSIVHQDSDQASEAKNADKWNQDLSNTIRSHANNAPIQSRGGLKSSTFRPPPLPCDIATNQSYSARQSSKNPERNRNSPSPPPPPPPLSLLSSSSSYNDYYMQ